MAGSVFGFFFFPWPAGNIPSLISHFLLFLKKKERYSISRLNNSNTQSDCTLDEVGVCFEKRLASNWKNELKM
jgi:hypothetical protein